MTFKQLTPFYFIILLITCHSAFALLPEKTLSGSMTPTLSPIIKKVIPAIVNISTTQTNSTNHPLFNNPLFREFYRIPPDYQIPGHKTQSTGSGVIIDSKGIIITNHHVVNGADNIEITLNTGDTVKATLIGSDPEVDIALLKVDRDNLQAISVGQSDLMEVGDFVIAIGNPFGLGQTVTTGIVSALGRSGLGIEGYEDFIQTDASINPGNSGGALINLKGEVIGINTAILAPAKGNVGIGFAIPMNMAMYSANQIMKHGEVKRGQLGITIQNIDEDLATVFNLRNKKGILISSVLPGSTAEKAGLQAGDVILAIDGNAINNVTELRNEIGLRPLQSEITVNFIRNSKEQTRKVKIGHKASSSSSFTLNSPGSKMLDGIHLTESHDKKGLLITAVNPGSPAFDSGLRKGDIILAANRMGVSRIDDLQRALKVNQQKLLLQVQRGQTVFFLVLH